MLYEQSSGELRPYVQRFLGRRDTRVISAEITEETLSACVCPFRTSHWHDRRFDEVGSVEKRRRV